MKTVLKIDGISKSYKSHRVLNSVSMTIQKGDIYGFVGKNGAGKTTLIRIIAGLADSDGGSYELLGVKNTDKRIDSARKKICAMVESPAIYPDLSATDNLKMQCMITGQDFSCINELLSFVNLDTTGKKKARDFSLGMRQRLGIAMALVNKPEIMLLDEPTNGLDPEGIKQIRELLLKMHSERHVTILISSHILTELSLFATRYGFIDKGVIIKEASAEEIRRATSEGCYIEADNKEKALSILHELHYEAIPFEDGIKVDMDIDLMNVCRAFDTAGIRLTKHVRDNLDLEEYFMNLIGE